MTVTPEQCVEPANRIGCPQCRSCGRGEGEEHHPGCPLRGALEASVASEPVAKKRRRKSKPKADADAPAEAPAEE